MVFGFEFVEDGRVDESDRNGGVGILSVIVDFGDVVIVRSEGFKDVVVIIEIEGEGISQEISP